MSVTAGGVAGGGGRSGSGPPRVRAFLRSCDSVHGHGGQSDACAWNVKHKIIFDQLRVVRYMNAKKNDAHTRTL